MIEHLTTNDEPFTPPGAEPSANGEGSTVRAELADRRLRNALRELRNRGEDVADDVRSMAAPMRVAGGALLAGLGAVLLVVAVRAASTRRRRPPVRRSLRAAVGRSLIQEIAARIALGAAGVVGAHLASDVILPALTRRLAAENEAPKKRRASKRSSDVDESE